MDDDEIGSALREIDRPTRPRDEFSDRLFERLVRETARRPALVPIRSIPTRRRPDLRRRLTVAAVLVVTIAILAVVVGPLRSLGSKRPLGVPTASSSFIATYEGSFPASGSSDAGGDLRIRVSYRDADAWRIDVLGGSAGDQPLINENVHGADSYIVWSNGTLVAYDGSSHRFVPQPAHTAWFSPLNLLGGLDALSGWEQACANGSSLGTAVIAGREATGTRCRAPVGFGSSDATVEVWQDVQSHLVLKLASQLDPGQQLPPGPIAWYEGESLTATSVEYDPTFPTDAFNAPSPAASPPTATSILSVPIGEAPPSFSGAYLDGRPFNMSSLPPEPTVLYFWADWCQPCGGTALDALQAAAVQRHDVDIVTIAMQVEPRSVRAYVRDHSYTVPVVIPDDVDALERSWGGPETIPTLVLLDASDRFVGAYSGWNEGVGTTADIGAILDAFASGRALPTGGPAFTSWEA